MSELPNEAYAILRGRHSDPFRYLGRHRENGHSVVRAYLPEASDVAVIEDGGKVAPLACIHKGGLFAGEIPDEARSYRLRARFGDNTVEFDDPYRFQPILTDFDLYLLGEGTHQHLYDKLGAHLMVSEGVEGVGFVVFAPNAQSVAVVGDFNYWHTKRHLMRVRGPGYWELFVPGARASGGVSCASS